MAGKNIFNSIMLKDRGYNRFDLTNDHKLSLRMGNLYPVFWDEAVPGDKWNISAEVLLKFFPMIAPVMHRFNLYVHYFYVPHRIMWSNFEKYYTRGGSTPVVDQGPLPAHPFVTMDGTNALKSSLADYLGIPTWGDPTVTPGTAGNTDGKNVNAFPFAAYQRIFTEYYQNENIDDNQPENMNLTDGDNNANGQLLLLRQRSWMHDYLTSALPTAQRGASVDIPLGEVQLKPDTTNPGLIKEAADHDPTTTPALKAGLAGQFVSNGDVPQVYDPNGTLETGATTITDLRRAFALQRYLEKLNIGGGRFKEFIKTFFRVNTGDARVDRPEYLCGVKQNVVIGEVLQTSATDVTTPQGNMAGHGIAVQKGGHCNYYVKEPGIIMGILSVMPVTAYQQGLDRKWNKITDPTEYFNAEFEHIGEQEIQRKEVMAFIDDASAIQPFGYIPRYAEYKYSNSSVHGDMRTNLNFWHAGRIFENTPSLNKEFNYCDSPDRIFAVDDENQDNLVAHVLNKISVARKMSKYSTPI